LLKKRQQKCGLLIKVSEKSICNYAIIAILHLTQNDLILLQYINYNKKVKIGRKEHAARMKTGCGE